jgi:hypothetical protein
LGIIYLALDLTTINHDICNFIRVVVTSTYLYFGDFACILNKSQVDDNKDCW